MKTGNRFCVLLLAVLLLALSVTPAFAASPRLRIIPAPVIEPNAAVEPPADASTDVDWDAVEDELWNLLFTGEKRSVDLRQYRIPYTDDNVTYLSYLCYFSPRFLRTCFVNLSLNSGYIVMANNTGANATDPAENRAKHDACVNVIDRLMSGIKGNQDLSDIDKCLLLHDRIAAWSAYNMAETKSADDYTPYGPLVLRTGVCNGYALAYNWMLDELGFTSYYTSSKQINHGWTKVILDGAPYYIDVTWDDPTYDIPGRVKHNHFMQSFATFSASHGATDFDQTPNSTVYESYVSDNFGTNITSQIVLIGNKFYYFVQSDDDCVLTSRDVNGGIESAQSLVSVYHWVDSGTPGLLVNYDPQLVAIGNDILYTAHRTVRVYNTVSQEDTLVYTPEDSLFAASSSFLRGIREENGTVYVTAGEVRFDATTVENYTASFVFCSHSYTAQTVRAEALKSEANCTTPATYYFSCTTCGAVEANDDHTFTNGNAAGHQWAWIVDTQPKCNAAGVKHEECGVCHETRNENTSISATGNHTYTAATVKPEALKSAATCKAAASYYYSCATCGTVERNNSHTFTSGGTIAHNWKWVVNVNPTCGAQGKKHEECAACHDRCNENTAISATGNHSDANGDGVCDNCSARLKDANEKEQTPVGACKYCGQTHSGAFGWLTKIIHSLLAMLGLKK